MRAAPQGSRSADKRPDLGKPRIDELGGTVAEKLLDAGNSETRFMAFGDRRL